MENGDYKSTSCQMDSASSLFTTDGVRIAEACLLPCGSISGEKKFESANKHSYGR